MSTMGEGLVVIIAGPCGKSYNMTLLVAYDGTLIVRRDVSVIVETPQWIFGDLLECAICVVRVCELL